MTVRIHYLQIVEHKIDPWKYSLKALPRDGATGVQGDVKPVLVASSQHLA
jgi:hypothetical protein